MPVTLLLSVLLLSPPLTPGRYVGTADTGQVWLELGADGTAQYGFAAYTWRLHQGALILERRGTALRLDVEPVAGGVVLTGPPFGRVEFRPAPLATQTPVARPRRPEAWRGRWVHRATGGQLLLELSENGRYLMIHGARGASGQRTVGQWWADRGLVLSPDGGASQRYGVRLSTGALFLSGGDLPMEVRFVPEGPP